MNFNQSHSIRVRGLKLFAPVDSTTESLVALHTSAWIETYLSICACMNITVALHTSAWIETISIDKLTPVYYSRTPYECVD